jgi:L-alanine-DL-glutamate epimerase-like enolase superfamily enzyme
MMSWCQKCLLMADTVRRIETFLFEKSRQVPYLGPVGPDDDNSHPDYIIRAGNGTIYPRMDRSILVRITTEAGLVGWGETYGLTAPQAVSALIDDLYGPQILGRGYDDPVGVNSRLYDLNRVRGNSSGIAGDALAALDIALWDLLGQRENASVATLLGSGSTIKGGVPAYYSGLPGLTVAEKVAVAKAAQSAGMSRVKLHAVVSAGDLIEEVAAIRNALCGDAKIAVDLHWKYQPDEALALIDQLAKFDLWFVEAPVASEDLQALTAVIRSSPVPIGVGEEWRNEFEARQRFIDCGPSIVQPEMGHTGISQFAKIVQVARAHDASVIPHATIGTGTFLTASLHASAAFPEIVGHEYQPSIISAVEGLVTGVPDCRNGEYCLVRGPGLGINPTKKLLSSLQRIGDCSA